MNDLCNVLGQIAESEQVEPSRNPGQFAISIDYERAYRDEKKESAKLRAEIKRLKWALEEHVFFNCVRGNLDAYLLDCATWALGGLGESDKPVAANFGVRR